VSLSEEATQELGNTKKTECQLKNKNYRESVELSTDTASAVFALDLVREISTARWTGSEHAPVDQIALEEWLLANVRDSCCSRRLLGNGEPDTTFFSDSEEYGYSTQELKIVPRDQKIRGFKINGWSDYWVDFLTGVP
jgi:hypothetical protein